MIDELEQFKDKISTQNSGSLSISRVPIDDLKWFIEFGKTEFANDYGMALKKLIDIYRENYPPSAFISLSLRLDALEDELNSLKQPKEQPIEVQKVKRMLGGREIKIRGEE